MIDFAAASDRATPGLVRERVGEWCLRAGLGATGRANSTTAHGDPGVGIEGAIDAVERFYATQGVPATVQVWDETPPAVAAELDRRGYTTGPTTEVMAGSRCTVFDRLRSPALTVDVAAAPPETFARSLTAERFREVTSTGLVSRFALASDETVALSVGMALLDPPLVGLFSLTTREPHRGQGGGSAVVRGLLDGLDGDGCDTVWLQVETVNTRALEWYARLGFTTRTRYRYRTSPFTTTSCSVRSEDARTERDSMP